MQLCKLLASLGIRTQQDVEISAITVDSREVAEGALFVAVPGTNVDGHAFIEAAVDAGAAAVVGERALSELASAPAVPYVQVPDAREAFGRLSAAWHGFPARRMTLIGVTGTDGKTTTVNLIHALLTADGHRTGMISTVNARIGERSSSTGLHVTTPPANEIQGYLTDMVEAGMTHAVLEATSQGLAQHRLVGCDFDVAVVTNVTHEHLDYHGSMEAYLAAKARLFRALNTAHRKDGQSKVAVLNADDPISFDYLQRLPADVQLNYGVDNAAADVVARDVTHDASGLAFTLMAPWGECDLRSPLVGFYNVHNILAAVTAALVLEVPLSTIAATLAEFKGVPGRMERIDEGQAFTAIVDFAHTPNALRRALETARDLTAPEGRTIVVFGSAGLRDREKRRLMGEVAAIYADLTVITAEDPRTESLDEIMAAIAKPLLAAGRREGVEFWRVVDRGAALRHAVSLARPGDVVLTCGKGHEQSMCFGATEYPWDDRRALRLALRGQTLDTLPTAGENGEVT
jgi:UDP-N-acetylmuramoyl-L-alanyl-D-glutamate--2,6-diaminopimelate ligase